MKHTVDTKGFLVLCKKFKTKLHVSIEDCSKCEHHQGIMEVCPVEQIINIKDVSLEPIKENGLLKQYDIICGLPIRYRATLYGSLIKE